MVFRAREAEAERQHRQREGEQAGDDKQESPQGEAGRRAKQTDSESSRRRGRRLGGTKSYPFCLFSSLK